MILATRYQDRFSGRRPTGVRRIGVNGFITSRHLTPVEDDLESLIHFEASRSYLKIPQVVDSCFRRHLLLR